MKKVINYLGKENVMVLIVENEDSKDNTRKYLKNFKNYLNINQVRNNILLKHKFSKQPKNDSVYSRVLFLSRLRNKAFDLLYRAKDIDFNNSKIVFFNDIIFVYEDIIKLIATNNEDYDSVCAMDFNIYFYNTWASADLNGNSFKHGYPYFINAEGQEQLMKLKPIRIFSCWRGVMVFTAAPLKNKKLKFRVEKETTKKKYSLNCYQKYEIESECTYIHIDMETLGYTKRLLNPDVKVAYEYKYYYLTRYFGQWTYFLLFFI